MVRSRLLAGMLGMVAAAALTPAAAHAAAATKIELGNIALLPDTVQEDEFVFLSNDERDFALTDAVVTIDTANLAGVATAKPTFDFQPCVAAGTTITCHYPTLASKDQLAVAATFSLKPVAGVKVGAEGSVAVTVTSKNEAVMTRTSKVTISEKVSMAVGENAQLKASPGETLHHSLTVKNTGDTTIHAADLFFFYESQITVPRRYANCEYAAIAAYCHVEVDIEPGQEFVTAEPVAVTLRKDVPAPGIAGVDFHWFTPIDGRDFHEMIAAANPVKGSGATLTLVKKPAATSLTVPQTEWPPVFLGHSQDFFYEVTGFNPSDASAVGATVRGAVGSAVTAKVGVKNLGPAYVSGFPDTAATGIFTPPAGTTVTAVPADCKATGATYTCATTIHPLEVGQTVTWAFGLRIDRAGPLTGSITVKTSAPDKTAVNNTAKLLVNPLVATSAPSTGGPAGGTGGGGPTLPITGVNATLLGGAAAILLLLGAGLIVVARRRTNFSA